jgi:hypothetical protein
MLTLVVAPQANAETHEFSQSELRAMVAQGQAKGLATILRTVGQRVKGETLDARAFDADGLVYQISIMLPDGRIANVYVDGVTGEFVMPRTSRANAVKKAAKSSPGPNFKAASKSTPTVETSGNSTGTSNANSNAGSKSNGSSNASSNSNGSSNANSNAGSKSNGSSNANSNAGSKSNGSSNANSNAGSKSNGKAKGKN